MAHKIKAERGGDDYTAQPLAAAAHDSLLAPLTGVSLRPEFFRLPRPGARCALSGLSRTSILENGEAGNFKMIRLRKRGAARGIVLVDTQSFLAWLHGQPAVQRES